MSGGGGGGCGGGVFFFNDTATTEIYTLSLHDALPISGLPEYDTFSGKPKISSRETTHLGKMLLREIDLFEEDSS